MKFLHCQSGFRPSMRKEILCQGSGKNSWLLTISDEGEVSFSRYGTNTYNDANSSTWLPFHVVFLLD